MGRHDFKDDEEKFKKLGFDRVYPPEADLDAAIKELKNDLKAKGKMQLTETLHCKLVTNG